MNWKIIWKLMVKADKWMHLAGSFMFTAVAIRLAGDSMTALLIVGAGAILLEVYQREFEPDYPTKTLDTALDLIADGIGIAVAILIWP